MSKAEWRVLWGLVGGLLGYGDVPSAWTVAERRIIVGCVRSGRRAWRASADSVFLTDVPDGMGISCFVQPRAS